MADTALVLRSNRMRSDSFLASSVATVALDAAVNETFYLPAGFGQLVIKMCRVSLGALSGAYVAPAPPFDGVDVLILGQDMSANVDVIGAKRWMVRSTTTARPDFAATFDMFNRVLLRQFDRVQIFMPVVAGAGVTGTIGLSLRGERIMTQ